MPVSATLEEGLKAPDFTLTDGEGMKVSLQELRGKHVILVDL